MSEDEIKRHTSELVRLTMAAARPEPLAEDELADLGTLIATERQLLIEGVRTQLEDDDPQAATSPGVAEFDAGFCYGLEFAHALDAARLQLRDLQRRRVLKLVKG